MSHSRTEPFPSSAASVVPYGLIAKNDDLERGLPIWCPVATSHSWTELPGLTVVAVASLLPSGLNATIAPRFVPPVFRARLACWGAVTSQSRAAPLSSPVARVLPSGLNATESTGLWPLVKVAICGLAAVVRMR